jgi:hypothetical protein
MPKLRPTPALLLLTLTAFACRGDSSGDDEVGATETGETESESTSESGESAESTSEESTSEESTSEESTSEESATDTTETDTTDTTETDTTDTDTGGIEPGLACGVLAGCVDACAPNDDMCQQTCFDAASMNGAAEYDAIVQCAVANNCNNEMCVNLNCAAELLACFSGPLTCGQFAACFEDCAGDGGCEGSCFVESTQLAQGQSQALQQCIEDNQCADEACIAENCSDQLQSCIGGMSDELPCPIVAECALDCGDDMVCIDACQVSASPTAQDEAPALLECADVEGCNDIACTEQACPDEWGACFSGATECADISACLQGCNNASLCEYLCLTEGSFMGQVLFGALAQCASDNQCADEQCVIDNCGLELAACGL